MYDVVVLGAGPAGLSAVKELVNRDKKVLLIDKTPLKEQDRQILTYTAPLGKFQDCIDTIVEKELWYYNGEKIIEVNDEGRRCLVDYSKFVKSIPVTDFECREIHSLKELPECKVAIVADGGSGRLAVNSGILSLKEPTHQTYCFKTETAYNNRMVFHYGDEREGIGGEVFIYPYRKYTYIGYGANLPRRQCSERMWPFLKSKVEGYIDNNIISEYYGSGIVDAPATYYKDNILFTGECVGLIEPLYLFGFEGGLFYGSLAGRFASEVIEGNANIPKYDCVVKGNELYAYHTAKKIRNATIWGFKHMPNMFKYELKIAKKIYEAYGVDIFYNLFDSKHEFWDNWQKYVLRAYI